MLPEDLEELKTIRDEMVVLNELKVISDRNLETWIRSLSKVIKYNGGDTKS